jgi:hypothetical protein
MMARWLFLIGILAALAALAAPGHAVQAAPACHPDRLSDTRVNLDGDTQKERVTALDSHDCAHTKFLAYVHIRDYCRGAWRTYDLQSEGDVLRQFRIANADGRTRRPEVFFVTQRLAPVARGASAVVRLDDRRSGCARLRALFRYTPSDPAVQSFDVELKNVASQFPGLEVVVTEAREVAQQVTRYRYDRARDRYVVYG